MLFSLHADVVRRFYSFHRLDDEPNSLKIIQSSVPFDPIARSVELWLNLRGLSEGKGIGDARHFVCVCDFLAALLLLLLSKLNLACCAGICASSIIPSSAFLYWV